MRDTQNGTTTMVDVSNGGIEADAGASWPAISYNGRFVVFQSTATNLVSGVSSGQHVYERDIVNGTTAIVDTNSSGTPGEGLQPDVNADGQFVTFVSSSNISGFGVPSPYYNQVMLKDMVNGTLLRLTSGTMDNSQYPSIDCDGHIVALVSGSDLTGGSMHTITYYLNDVYYATIGLNGTSHLTDATISTNPMNMYELDPPQISCNGNAIVYNAGGGGHPADPIYEYNRLTGSFTLLSGSSNNQYGGYSVASVSDDGRYVAFVANATNLDSSHPTTYKGSNYDVYVVDAKTGSTQLVSFTALGNMSGLVPAPHATTSLVSISPDGSTVAYAYATPNSSNPNGELISGVDTGVTDIYTSQTGF